MAATSILIKDATVITVDEKLGTQLHCDILVEDGVIKAVGPGLSANSGRVDEVIDGTNCIVSPGFVDTHHHLWQQLLRGVTTDWSLGNYIEHIRNVYGSLYTPEDVYTANYFAGLDLLNNGITTVIDHCHILNSPKHVDAAIKGLKDAHVRGTWCFGFYENPGRADLPDANHTVATPAGFDHAARVAEARRAREEHFPDNDPATQLLTFGGAPAEAEGMTLAALQQEIDLFRSLGARVITMHVAMGNYDVNHQIVQQLGDAGYLGRDLLFSHGASFTESEFALIRAAGAGVSSTPETDLQMGMGHPVAFKAAARGCHVGLGIDITSNQNNDFLALMRLLLQAERGKRHGELLQAPHRTAAERVPLAIAPQSHEALYMATLGGARSIHLDHLIGSITPGKRADLVVTRCDDMNAVPVTNPIGALMFNVHIGNIDTVLVNGKIVKQGGQVLNVDWPKLRAEVRERSARMYAIDQSAPPPPRGLWNSLISGSPKV
ncbi:Metal-dependent hydrolase, composite domain protein [Niveomyces insectorum RCEF 264]|uniref:Metal-dependent hydrolase, composite domain protein n=1 Tax=Niveomyces insectorum RCEF 264 TaxID=1081102 RepID=A0A167ZX23_9HYPO|nr:Metal-dependent hydrolase, composite domain protein [Niveomyces insectorum RCEF 264]